MKKITVVVLALVMASAATFADDEVIKKGEGDRMARMQQNLGLSDQQVAQIRQIRDNGGSREEILAVLTPEQLAELKKRRAEMKGKGGKGGKGGRRVPVEESIEG
jgi:Spy/CpxP family protein refolding chaperone